MILYHGTDSKNLDSILKYGLLPRKNTGQVVYTGGFASNEDFVYLTRWNPVAHAYSIDENKPLILKVRVNEDDLYPDEDYLERKLTIDSLLKTGQPWNGHPSDIDISQFKNDWKECFNKFGNVAIHSVPPEDIVSHAVLDPNDFGYHCGLGAQGNMHIKNRKDTITFIRSEKVKKYERRLDILFNAGWDATKRDIMKERPSLALDLAKPKDTIRVRGRKLPVLCEPNIQVGLHVYICDEWYDNFPYYPCVDKRFLNLVQIPITRK